jgi:hypothetical protein
MAIASCATPHAASELRKTSTISTFSGTSASVAYPAGPAAFSPPLLARPG